MKELETVNVHQTLRPIRYAFIVDLKDQASCIKAVSLNTILWGGVYNPIFAHDDPTLENSLKDFDPDFLIQFTNNEISDSVKNAFSKRIISSESELVRQCTRKKGQNYLTIGFNLLPIYREIYREETRTSGDKEKFCVFSTSVPEWDNYLAFRFGTFSNLPETPQDYRKWYCTSVNAKEMRFDPEVESEEHFDIVPPIALTAKDILSYGNDGALSSHVAFIGNHDNLQDLVDFWNIRATGRKVQFVPLSKFTKWKKHLVWIIESGNYPINPSVNNQCTILKGKSVEENKFTEVVTWISNQNYGPISVQNWFPRYGQNEPQYVGDIHSSELEVTSEDDHSFFNGRSLTPIKAKGPDLEPDFLGYDYNWAIQLRFGELYQKNEFTLAFPKVRDLEDRLNQIFLSASQTPGRISNKGPVAYLSGTRQKINVFPLKTYDLFSAMFSSVNLKIQPSDPGRYVSQIIKAFGGGLQFDCRILKIRGVRQILHYLSEGKTLDRGSMHKIFSNVTPDAFGANWVPSLYNDLCITPRKAVDFGDVFTTLTEKKVIRPGLLFKCHTCHKKDWYHVSEFKEEYTCRYCFTEQQAHLTSQWQYKSDGIFQIDNSVQGSISVIPALWRIDHECQMNQGKYLTSVLVKSDDGSIDCELDYAYFSMKSFDSSEYDLVLGEAKSYTDLEKVENIANLAKRFGAANVYLAFSTLKDTFSSVEKVHLNELKSQGFKIIPMTRLDLDPYALFERFKGLNSHLYGLKGLSQNLSTLNL